MVITTDDQKEWESGDQENSMEDEKFHNGANRVTRLRKGCWGQVQNNLRNQGGTRLSSMLKGRGKWLELSI